MAYTKKNLLVLLFITAFLMTGCNFSQEVDMEEWIIPYREMVNEINQENGWPLPEFSWKSERRKRDDRNKTAKQL